MRDLDTLKWVRGRLAEISLAVGDDDVDFARRLTYKMLEDVDREIAFILRKNCYD
jgi:hypothetical protein